MGFFEPEPSYRERHRRTKFTDANLRQIVNLVERGTSPSEIAEIIGVTLGTLKATCSKLHISLRRPSFDTGTGLLRRRHADRSSMAPKLASRPGAFAQKNDVARVESHSLEQNLTTAANSDSHIAQRPVATIAIVMRYKGEVHTGEILLTPDLIGQLAIESWFRGVTLVELLAQAVECLAKGDHFVSLLGPIRKRVAPAASSTLNPNVSSPGSSGGQ
jgi:hypothetical protein